MQQSVTSGPPGPYLPPPNLVMINHWTPFPGRPHGRQPRSDMRITINSRGVIYMNPMAWTALGRPPAVEMLFDKHRSVIGLKPADPFRPEVFPVKDKKNARGKVISASAFCTHFLIKVVRTGMFNDIEVGRDGIMSLSLLSLSAVGRGSR